MLDTRRRALAGRLAGRFAPIWLAVAFGILSVPLVAASFVDVAARSQRVEAEWERGIVRAVAVEPMALLLLALASALTASVVGGCLGARLVRRQPIAACLVALGASWPIGIGMLSITAAAAGIGVNWVAICIDACNPAITDTDRLSGFAAYWESVVVGCWLVVPPVTSAVLLVVAFWLGRRTRPRVFGGCVLLAVAYGVLHLWSIGWGAVAFACLAGGVVVWGTALYQPATRSQEPAPLARTLPTQPSPANG